MYDTKKCDCLLGYDAVHSDRYLPVRVVLLLMLQIQYLWDWKSVHWEIRLIILNSESPEWSLPSGVLLLANICLRIRDPFKAHMRVFSSALVFRVL